MDFGYVKFIAPSHPELKKWIKGYYIHKSSKFDFESKVTFYQNITSTISIYKDSYTTSMGRSRKQHYKKGIGFSSLLVGLVDKYQEVEFFGPLDRLAIVFHPGGINQFIDEPLGNLLKKHYSHFKYFDQEFQELLPTVFNEFDIIKKKEILDSFFITHFKPFKEPLLSKAIEFLVHSTNTPKVEDLATSLGMSRRTLLRKFKTHLGYSIEEYKQVIKFRKALLIFQRNQEKEKMTQIALESEYYDQPDFNHHIRSQSNLTPKELFRRLEIVDNTLFWKL